jgi:hypothetical protein
MDFLMLIKCSLILLGKSKKPDHSFGFLESVLICEPVFLQYVVSIMREMYQLDLFRSCRILLEYIQLKMRRWIINSHGKRNFVQQRFIASLPCALHAIRNYQPVWCRIPSYLSYRNGTCIYTRITQRQSQIIGYSYQVTF